MSRFCYEQVVPLTMSKAERNNRMFQELKTYFRSIYDVEVNVRKINIPCYILISSSPKKDLKTRGGEHRIELIIYNDRNRIKYTNYDLIGAFNSSCLAVLKVNDILINGTNILYPIDIILPTPDDLKSLDDLRAALIPYGLDIIRGKRDVRVLEIRDKY